MSKSSSLSSTQTLRRQPQQKRGQERVEKILLAAAEVFAEAGYAAATVQQIADRASTAVGSIYQFFPDKLALFQALGTKHIQQVEILSAAFLATDMKRPLRQLVSEFVDIWAGYLAQPIPRSIILQYHLHSIPDLFISLGDMRSTQLRWIDEHAQMYRRRNPNLDQAKSKLLAEVANDMCNSLFLCALQSDARHCQEIYAEIKDVLYGYLSPHIGDHLLVSQNQISDSLILPISHSQLMICPDCQCDRIAKNGRQQDKQRYICRGCRRQFVDQYIARGYPLEIRQACLDLHQQGVSFREIERRTGVSHNTVINWVKSTSTIKTNDIR
jgi:AcrR family transcriptional regulator/transposase-like protein